MHTYAAYYSCSTIVTDRAFNLKLLTGSVIFILCDLTLMRTLIKPPHLDHPPCKEQGCDKEKTTAVEISQWTLEKRESSSAWEADFGILKFQLLHYGPQQICQRPSTGMGWWEVLHGPVGPSALSGQPPPGVHSARPGIPTTAAGITKNFMFLLYTAKY